VQRLRSIHLYLGCLFAPMLLFFAVSGIWQTFEPDYKSSKALAWLSTIHTSRGLKTGTLTSAAMRDFVLLMSVSFIVTTLLGVAMAVRFGKAVGPRGAVWPWGSSFPPLS
jgi:hypothetical protein